VFSSLKTEPRVCTSDDDCLARKVDFWHRRGLEDLPSEHLTEVGSETHDEPCRQMIGFCWKCILMLEFKVRYAI
jgi:hypothetical protein